MKTIKNWNRFNESIDYENVNDFSTENHINESAIEVIGGILLGILGIRTIVAIFKYKDNVLEKITSKEKLKEILVQMSEQAKNKTDDELIIKNLDSFFITIDGMIDNGEIKNGKELKDIVISSKIVIKN